MPCSLGNLWELHKPGFQRESALLHLLYFPTLTEHTLSRVRERGVGNAHGVAMRSGGLLVTGYRLHNAHRHPSPVVVEQRANGAVHAPHHRDVAEQSSGYNTATPGLARSVAIGANSSQVFVAGSNCCNMLSRRNSSASSHVTSLPTAYSLPSSTATA